MSKLGWMGSTGIVEAGDPPDADLDRYRVEKQLRPEDDCACPNCTMWTVMWEEIDGATEIGTSWQGDAGKEAAEEVCDLMNMAYALGLEDTAPSTQSALLDASGRARGGP